MIRRHVLAALGAGIEAGDDDVARAALRRVDWAVRKLAKRRFERAMIDAGLATTEPDPGHVMRVAALALAKRDIAANDRDAVAAAYAKLAMPRPSRVPVATIALALAAVVAVVGSILYYDSLPGRPSKAYARPLPPPAAGAYRDGGVPLRDDAVQQFLVGDFTKYVLAADRDRRNGGSENLRAPFAAAVKAATVIKKHGPVIAKEWDEMIAALDLTVELDASTREWREAAEELRAEVRDVSDQLGSVGLGYYLEGTWRQGASSWAIVYTYAVEEVVFVLAGEQRERRRVLSLRRLDNINITKTLLGMQSEELGDPVLLLDQIDAHVATRVLPALAKDAPYELADEDYQRSDEGKRFALAAGEAVRRELATALGADFAAAQDIAALLAERRGIVERWRKLMEKKSWTFSRTDELFLPDGLLDTLEGHVPGSERTRVAHIEDALVRAGAARIASRVHDIVAASVRRHEAQHGLDDDRDAPLRYPAELADHLGPATTSDGDPRASVDSARAELSAYASQLANDPATPHLTLWFLSRHAFQRHAWGTAESIVAVVIVEGLARELGIASAGPIIHDREIDRARLGHLVLALTATHGDPLRAATRRLWNRLYGEPPVTIVGATPR